MSANSRVLQHMLLITYSVSVTDFGGRILFKTLIYLFGYAVCVGVS